MIANTLPLLRSVCPDSVAAFAPKSKAGPPLYPILCSREVLGAASYFVLAAMLADCKPRPRESSAREGTFIDTLQHELESRRYRLGTVSRFIKSQLHRPRLMLFLKDRVVHTALFLVLDAVLSEVCSENDPVHVRTLAAVRATVRSGSYGFDAFDIEGRGGMMNRGSYQTLLRLVAIHVHDDDLLRLLKLFLKAPVVDVWGRDRRAAG
ncbi:hypothetical protein OPIT5_06335 [Opitutaceae bacterium TAV5]|nr:hypothetical protein OPIT5_06335 [Opitutaceae bacterium TAV5]